MKTHFLITGCSGGGKSTLLAAVAAAGFHTIEEPGRRIVAQERQGSGKALPWVDPQAFLHRALDMARDDLARAKALAGPVFFDRGVLDAAVNLAHLTGRAIPEVIGAPLPYARKVMLAPPWPEIFTQDPDRQHGVEAAIDEYHLIKSGLRQLGYEAVELPRFSVAKRVSFVRATLGL